MSGSALAKANLTHLKNGYGWSTGGERKGEERKMRREKREDGQDWKDKGRREDRRQEGGERGKEGKQFLTDMGGVGEEGRGDVDRMTALI